MEVDYWIVLEACDPERNIWRSYRIAAGRDLFGDWIVERTYGRTGCKGRTVAVRVADEDEARRFVKTCLKKRERAHKRIGIGYAVKDSGGIWGDLGKA